MRISTQQLQQSAIDAVLDQQSKVSKTQLQIATGQRILKPSDDPIASSRILDLKQSLATTKQFQFNGTVATARLELEEGTLGNVTNLMHRVRELAVQAGNTIQTNADRRFLALEVSQILDELLALSNAKDNNNNYLFSGFQGNTRPFVRNNVAGTFDYFGDDGQRLVQVGTSRQVADSDSGNDVFRFIKNGNGTFSIAEGGNTGGGNNQGTAVIDPGTVAGAFVSDTYTITFNEILPATTPSTYNYTVTDSGGATILGPLAYQDGANINLSAVGIQTFVTGTPADGDRFTISPSVNQDIFQTVDNFMSVLQAGFGDDNGQAAFRNSLNAVFVDLDQSAENILNVRAKIGARLNTIDSERNNNDTFTLQVESTLSAVQDLDFAEAISRLNLQLVGLQAAQQSFVRIQGLSLFNYL